ncbi:MAG: DUF763 domain-containing protein [Desulfurococcales archaeon]|nr:DUF763 domain-containing protein [Desulfurococcales archaeon]
MTGVADLPLHSGHVPPWMLKIMRELARGIVNVIVLEFGPEKIIEGLKDPLWFQAFNNVIGMDWDSSGSTTILTSVLKDLTWKEPELGFIVLGGKGSKGLRVPDEIKVLGELYNLESNKLDELEKASRIAAKADTAFFQDGYKLYHHTLIVTESGSWIVIQQGMSEKERMARRYHIDRSLVKCIHSGVAGIPETRVTLNLSVKEASKSLRFITELSKEPPRKILNLVNEANSLIRPNILDYVNPGTIDRKYGRRGYYIPVKPSKQLVRSLEALYDYQPQTPEELALVRGAGPATIRALALISDLIYSVPSPDKDNVTHPIEPYRYTYAVGGKDGVPYPFDSKTARKIIEILEYAVNEAKLDDKTKLRAIKRMRTILPWWRKHGLQP